MVTDAWCLCFRAWLPVWQISLFGMSEYSAMMAGIMKDVIADMDAISDPVWRGQDRHGIRRGRCAPGILTDMGSRFSATIVHIPRFEITPLR
jgi:hypothetical protein